MQIVVSARLVLFLGGKDFWGFAVLFFEILREGGKDPIGQRAVAMLDILLDE